VTRVALLFAGSVALAGCTAVLGLSDVVDGTFTGSGGAAASGGGTSTSPSGAGGLGGAPTTSSSASGGGATTTVGVGGMGGADPCVLYPDYAKLVFDDGASNHWRLGDAAGSAGAAESIGGRTGIYGGSGPALEVPGVVPPDTAARFNGANSEISSVANISSVFHDGKPFSVELWLGTPTLSTADPLRILARHSSSATDGWELALVPSSSEHHVRFTFWHDTVASVAEHDVSLVSNSWHHVVAAFDGTSLIVYLDGVPKMPVPAGQQLDNINTSFYFGCDGSQCLVGTLDELALYPMALPPERVALHAAWPKLCTP
jgi:hypothetical protein